MRKIIIATVLAAAMALTGCSGEITEKANGALESAQNAAGDAIESKAADYVDGAVGNMEIPDIGGETELPAAGDING